MSNGSNGYRDHEDLFSDTRMTFGEHIEELRWHLWRAILGFVVAVFLAFFISKPVLYGFIIRPVEIQLQEFFDEQVKDRIKDEREKPDSAVNQPQFTKVQFLRQHLKEVQSGQPLTSVDNPAELPAQDWVELPMRIPDPLGDWERFRTISSLVGTRPSMKTFNIAEAFMVYFKISLVCGFVLASPWVFYQLWSFVAAGLYPNEKRLVNVYMPFSVVLFFAGVASCQFVVLPKAISALLWFNKWLNVEPDLRLNEWLGFAIMLPLIFGISFQTPLVMVFLERLGIMSVETYRRKRKIAFFILAVIAAIGPTIDAFSMLFQWVALCLLYQLGIWMCMWSPKRQSLDIDVPDPEEMVEV